MNSFGRFHALRAALISRAASTAARSSANAATSAGSWYAALRPLGFGSSHTFVVPIAVG